MASSTKKATAKKPKFSFEIGRVKDMEIEAPEFYPTGVLLVDEKLGGGFAKGRIVELFGQESSGKTSLSMTAIGKAQEQGLDCLYIDLERSWDASFANMLGVDTDNLFITEGGLAEETLEALIEAAASGDYAIIVLDSVAGLMAQAEFDGEIGQANIGATARVLGQALRKLVGAAADTGTTVIFINQLRDNVGSFVGPSKVTPGGKAMKFFASQRIEVVGNIGQIKASDGTPIGKRTIMKVVKNKLAPPLQQCEVEFYFDSGFSNGEALLDVAISEGRIKQKGTWFYDGVTGEKIGQGRAAAFAYVESSSD